MSTKYKTTGCAKFFLILVILAPLAYIGASYYNGQDGIENIKGIFGSGKNTVDPDNGEDIYKLKNQLSKYQKDAEFFEKEMHRLEKELEACQSSKG
jgi:cell division protein FtsB